MTDNSVWMVRAGSGGHLIEDFKRGYIAIGWEMGDLSDVDTLEGIRDAYLKTYPDFKPGKIRSQVSVIHKFRTVLENGARVITYSPSDRTYLVGTVVSDYYFDPDEIQDNPHIRRVHWEGTISRDDLSATSRNSLGCASTVFSVNEDVWAEFQTILQGKAPVPLEERIEEEKEELNLIKEETVSRAHEFIMDKLQELSDGEMEELGAAILRAMGYRTKVSKKGPDRGVDILASPDGLGLEEPRIKVEVKHRKNTTMGSHEIRSFIGGLREGDRGIYLSTGGFSKEAKYEAERSNIPVALVDLEALADLIVAHYENFDTEGRALIPLVRIYWPVD